MKSLLSIALALCLLTSYAPVVPAQSVSIIENKHVVEMVRANLQPELIIAKIKSSRCRFDTFPGVLAELKQKGVPDEVLMAMVEFPNGVVSSDSAKGLAASRPAARNAARTAAEPEAAVEGEEVALPDGTEFMVTPSEEINSKHATEGQLVTFRVVDDVEVGGRTLVAKGALVRGTVTDVEGRGMLGKAGKLSVRVDSVKAVDGQKVRLRASKGKEGGSNTGKVIALSLLVTPLFLLMRGNTARIKPGQHIQVFTDEDKQIIVPVRPAAAARQ